jgi:hypothetical protein
MYGPATNMPHFVRKCPAPAFPPVAAFAKAAGDSVFIPRGHLMFPKPKPELVPNTYAYESEPMVKAT